MESIPEKYHRPYSSPHEGLAILQEEFEELKDEVFFGEKRIAGNCPNISNEWMIKIHKKRLREEAIQVAAVACRIIQELT